MGLISFQPIQPGTGEPSQHNRRPIYAPLNIDGIGEIWGGELNTNTATITATWNGIVLDGVNGKVNTEYLTDLTIRAGMVYLPNTSSGERIPIGISVRREYVLTDSIPYMNEFPDDPLPYWYLPQTGRLYVVVAVAYREDYPDITTKNQCIAFVNEWLTEHPAQFVYLLTPSFYTTYHLTTAQLNQAMSQLGVPISSMQEVMHQIAMDTPHLITPTAAEVQTFNTNMIAPLQKCKVHFSPVQAAGTPSRENPLPISGWTGIDLRRTKDVRLDQLPETESDNSISGVTILLRTDGRTIVKGTATARIDRGIVKAWISDGLPATITGVPVMSGVQWYAWDNTSNSFILTRRSDINTTFTAPAGHSVTWAALRINKDTSVDFELTPMLVRDYENIPIDWSTLGEIPGGYMNLVNGLLLQTWQKLKINQMSWSYYANGGYFRTVNTNAVGGTIPICSCYGYNGGADKSVSTTSTGRRVIFDSSFEGDVNAMLNAVGEEYLCWQIKTPITYQLDPVTLKTLRGLNNIWSNANGNIELSYWKH